MCITGWLKSVGSQILYELDHRKPVLYVIPIQNILGKLPVAPVGDTGTIPHHLRNVFPGAPGDRRPGAGCGLSTRGLLVGPVICNEGERKKLHGESFHQSKHFVPGQCASISLLLLLFLIIFSRKKNNENNRKITGEFSMRPGDEITKTEQVFFSLF